MTTRSYHQYCPIAHALDLVGDRWSLLIVRDLLLGPKRFSDLREGLPGIGTNILTDRLKGLELAGVLARRALPPPAAATVYELTPYGRGLDGPIQALAMWGGQTLGFPQPGQVLSRDSLLLTIRALARSLPAGADPLTYAFRLTDFPLPAATAVRVAGGQAAMADAQAAEVDLQLELDVNTLFALAGGALTLAAAVATGALRAEGRPDLVERLAAE